MKNLLYGAVARRRIQINYFGDGSDGDVTISSDTNLTAVEDGDMILKQYSSLIIDGTKTLTTDNRCKGLFVYVQNDCTINGILSMTARGAHADPTNDGVNSTGLRYAAIKSGETGSLAAADFAGCGNAVINVVSNQPSILGNGKIFQITREGAAGGGSAAGSPDPGNAGGNGTTGQSGGGGSGGSGSGSISGAGAAGTCFSGGSAGGGTNNGAVSAGTVNGGAGGNGTTNGGGGAGNPGGTNTNSGENGTGGLIILIVGGNLTIGGSASILAKGKLGGASYAGGGSSGGGNILILYKGDLVNSGTISADGGATAGTVAGGAGGNGSVQGPTQIQ